jgi:hypothetical protein
LSDAARLMTATEDIDHQLQPDEKLLWQGRPRAGFIFRLEQVPSMIVGVSMLVASGWMLVSLIQLGFGLIGFEMLVVFALFGLWLSCGIVALDMRCRSSTYYAVTDRRIIIQSEYSFVNFGSLPLVRLNGKPQMLKVGADGTIHFGYPLFSHLAHFWGPLDRMGGIGFPRLECLENPQKVYRVIRRAQRRLLSADADRSSLKSEAAT